MLPSSLAWRLVLAVSVCTTLIVDARAAQACPAHDTLLERFIPAECETCWKSAAEPKGTPIVLDWIVPGPRGDDAPLAAAALREAGVRAGLIAQTATASRRHALLAVAGLTLEVEDGPAFNGYLAAQIHVERDASRGGRSATAGAAAYLALVEQVRAGEEGTPIERMLVRAVVGPLPLGDGETKHLHAFRIPQGSRPVRLTAVGWVEAPDGKVLAAARVEPERCPPAR